jgi:hypothetical protein
MEQEMEAMRAQAAEEEADGEDQELDEATQALADVDLNENATEHGIDLPPSEGAVKDDPNFDAEKSASGLYKVELKRGSCVPTTYTFESPADAAFLVLNLNSCIPIFNTFPGHERLWQ